MARALALIALVCAPACDRVFQLTEVSDASARGDSVADGDGEMPDAPPYCFRDGFDDAGIDMAKWSTTLVPPTSVAQSAGSLVFTMGEADGYSYATITSTAFDFTGGAASIACLGRPSDLTSAEAGMSLQTDGTHRYLMMVTKGYLVMRVTDGIRDDDVSAAFDAVGDAYWRIEDGGTSMIFETSSDRDTWTVRRVSQQPVPTNALRITIFGGTYKMESSPGQARFDDVMAECAP